MTYYMSIIFQQLIKSFEVCDLPVRNAKFVARKNWILTGSVRAFLHVFSYSVLEINFFAGNKYFLPGIKGSSKTNTPSSEH